MAVQIYKNGAWTTPTNIKRYKDGAWVNVTSMKKYVNGEWVELLKSAPVGSLATELVYLVSSSTSYSYNITNNGTTINCKINGAVSGDNHIPFRITKAGGFGKTIKLKYTVTQTMTTSAYASSRWLKMDYLGISNSSGIWYNYYPCNELTYEDTITLDTDQQFIFLLFGAYSGNFDCTIKNVYINDELVTFK